MYEVKYHCNNCGHNFTKSIPKGTQAPLKLVCLNCECFTGDKFGWGTAVKFGRLRPDRITIDDFIPIRPRPKLVYPWQKHQTWAA